MTQTSFFIVKYRQVAPAAERRCFPTQILRQCSINRASHYILLHLTAYSFLFYPVTREQRIHKSNNETEHKASIINKQACSVWIAHHCIQTSSSDKTQVIVMPYFHIPVFLVLLSFSCTPSLFTPQRTCISFRSYLPANPYIVQPCVVTALVCVPVSNVKSEDFLPLHCLLKDRRKNEALWREDRNQIFFFL